MVEPVPHPSPVDYFAARERRLTLALRVSEVLNSLVRPLLAIMFGGSTVYMAVVGMVTTGEFLTVAAVVILWFFKARDDEKAQTRLETQSAQMVDLATRVPAPTQIESRPPGL